MSFVVALLDLPSTAALVDQEGEGGGGGVCSSSKSEEAVELCLTGTQSQVNFTRHQTSLHDMT